MINMTYYDAWLYGVGKKEHVPMWVSKEALGSQQCRKKAETATKNLF